MSESSMSGRGSQVRYVRFSALVLLVIASASLLWCKSKEGRSATSVPEPTAPQVTPTREAAGTYYPLGTRTGVVYVDAALEAVETRDVGKLKGLMRFFPRPCAQPGSINAAPCQAGQPLGTLVDVVGRAGCERTFLVRGTGDADRVAPDFLMELDPRLYAVARQKLGGADDAPGEFLLVFASAHALSVDRDGVSYFVFPCGEPEDLIAWGASFLLPPN